MNVRIVNHLGEVIAEGSLDYSRKDLYPPQYPREVVRVLSEGSYKCQREGSSWGTARVSLAEKKQMPLWYGGTYWESGLDFTLPSGFHNVWGCGNDFDTDAYCIHPEDLVKVIELAKVR